MGFIGELGMSAATTAVNAGTGGLLGMLFAGANDRRQIRQQTKLQELQIKGNKQMMDYQAAKELQMWKDTNYPAQVAMLQEAGLNPGLLYGKGGGGGTTVGGGSASVSGGNAPAGGGEILGMANLAAQNNLIHAQTKNVEADTAKKVAEAAFTGGAQTTLANTQTASLTQGIQNQKATERLTQLQSDLQQIENRFANETFQARWQQIVNINDKMENEINLLQNQNEINQATTQDKINQIKAESIGAGLKNLLTEAQINATNATIQKMAADIAQGWQNLNIQQFKAEMEAQYPGITKALGRVFDDGVNSIFKFAGEKRLPHNTMKNH